MKNLLLVSALALAVILAGCSKSADEVMPASQKAIYSAKKPHPVPIEGSINAIQSIVGANSYSIDGTGDIDHLGSSTIQLTTTTQTIYIGQLPYGGSMNGSGKMIAANGDELWATISCDYVFNWNSNYSQLLSNTITSGTIYFTGGTGRFEGASGEATCMGTQDMTGWPGPVPSMMTFSGEIQY